MHTHEQTRMTAEEALNHPWLSGETAVTSPLDPLVLQGLRSFDGKSRFKNTILHLMVTTLSQAEVDALRVPVVFVIGVVWIV